MCDWWISGTNQKRVCCASISAVCMTQFNHTSLTGVKVGKKIESLSCVVWNPHAPNALPSPPHTHTMPPHLLPTHRHTRSLTPTRLPPSIILIHLLPISNLCWLFICNTIPRSAGWVWYRMWSNLARLILSILFFTRVLNTSIKPPLKVAFVARSAD